MRTPLRTLAVLGAVFSGLLLLPDSKHASATRVWEVPLYAIACTGIFHAIRERRLFAATLLFLILPSVLFAATWLRPWVAVVATAALLVSFLSALRAEASPDSAAAAEATTNPDGGPTTRALLCFVLVVVWVHLSGVGGYAYQNMDWELHNGRLLDLVNHPWPVTYEKNQTLVIHLGYFLPAAAIGKALGSAAAFRALYLWTLLGVWLTMRWLARLSGHRLDATLAAIFVFFGGLDVVGYWYAGGFHLPMPAGIDQLCFWTQPAFGLPIGGFNVPERLGFVGNFLPNTFQLYWAPHQVIAGWLVVALVTGLFWARRPQSLAFVYALLLCWSPLITLGLLPYVGVLAAAALREQGRALLSVQNVLAPVILAMVFAPFYASGSAATNPAFFLPAHLAFEQVPAVILFYALGCGVYLLLILPGFGRFDAARRVALGALATNLLVVPWVDFGAYSDLLCRTSAPLLFVVLVYLLLEAGNWRPRTRIAVLAPVLVLASASALYELDASIRHFGQTWPAVSPERYRFAYENLGSGDSFFARHLARRPPPAELP